MKKINIWIFGIMLILLIAAGLTLFGHSTPKKQENTDKANLLPTETYAEANIVAKVRQSLNTTTPGFESLPVIVTEVTNFSGQPMIKKGDEISLEVRGVADLGCKDLNGDGSTMVPNECENIGKPERIYANWKAFTLKIGDTIRIPVKCVGRADRIECLFWYVDDSDIEIL